MGFETVVRETRKTYQKFQPRTQQNARKKRRKIRKIKDVPVIFTYTRFSNFPEANFRYTAMFFQKPLDYGFRNSCARDEEDIPEIPTSNPAKRQKEEKEDKEKKRCTCNIHVYSIFEFPESQF